MTAVSVVRREVRLHGRQVSLLEAGADSGGPVVILLHGLAGDSATWTAALPLLGEHFHVIAPDLLGHGRSAKPRSGDYSLGAYAAGLRDLMVLLDLRSATVAGHSFGGGVAMQFAYQYPELTERLVLVASGGLGQGVNIALRAATLPGVAAALQVNAALTPRWLSRLTHRIAKRIPALAGSDLDGLFTAFDSFVDGGARNAFVHTARGALDWTGQRLGGEERFYLLADVPVLLISGTRDPVIPVEHTIEAHHRLPGSRLDIIEGAGHFPHAQYPDRFATQLAGFVTTTVAARGDRQTLRRHIRSTTTANSSP